MSYTLTQLEDAAKHAAGKSTFDTGNSPTFCVQQALGEFNHYPWSWRHKTTTLTLTNGQNYVALPTDFCELVYLRGGASTNRILNPATVGQVMDWRSSSTSGVPGDVMFYAVDAVAQANGTSAATYKLQVYPTPDATESDAIQLQYLREITAPATGSNVADIPNHLFPVLLTLVKGYAELYENNNPAGNWQVGHQMLAAAENRDAMTQRAYGPLKGLTNVMNTVPQPQWFQNPIVTI